MRNNVKKFKKNKKEFLSFNFEHLHLILDTFKDDCSKIRRKFVKVSFTLCIINYYTIIIYIRIKERLTYI